MKPDFSNINYKNIPSSSSKDNTKEWKTAEQISVKNTYSLKDVEDFDHLNFAAGIAPNLRGPYSTMYVMRHGPSGNMLVLVLPKIGRAHV